MESVNFIKANAQARKPFFLFHAFAHQHGKDNTPEPFLTRITLATS